MSTSKRSTLLLAVPLAFVAGVLAMVVMTRAGVISVNSAQTSSSISSGTLSSASSASTLTETSDARTDSTRGQLALINERLQELEQQLLTSTNQADLTRAQTDKKLDELARELEQNIAAANLPNANQSDGTAVAGGEQHAAFGNRRFGPTDAQEQYDNLVLAGIDPYVAQEIQQRSDQWSLERLELIDQATREGWRDSEQFGERLQALRETRPDIRSELGDDDYDNYLYTAGDSNRVAVSSIINGSAAQQSGLQNGDVVVSYANNRVFGSRELQRATRDGQRGESVQVEVLRNGQVITVDVPRGPLGVTLTGSRVNPDE